MSPYFKKSGYLLLAILFLSGVYGAYIYYTINHQISLTECEKEYLLENSPVRVGIDQGFSPYEFKDQHGQIRGLTVDYLHILSIKTGVNFEFISMTWAEAISSLRRGDVDMLTNVTPTPQRDEFMKYTQRKDIFDQTSSIYILRHVVGVNELDDLNNRRVGAKASTSVSVKIEQYSEVELVKYATSEHLLEALLAGEIAAVVDYDYPFKYALFRNSIRNVKKVPHTFHIEPGHFAVRRENTKLLAILNKGMAVVTGAEIENLRRKWLGGPDLFSPSPGEKIIAHVLREYYLYFIGVALVVLFLIIWNFILQKQVDHATVNLRRSEAALKKSLREKEILLKEVHHRVKNNLFTIISILEMQQIKSEDQDVKKLLTQSVNRVHSMALIHQKIYSAENIEELNFSEYLRELVDNLIDSCVQPEQEIEVQYEVEYAPLDIDRIIPCALAVNELVSNALMHGFQAEKEGFLRIKYARRQGNYMILIENDGRPLPPDFDIKENSSLGLNLVNSLICDQLAGDIEAHSNDTVVFKITFPVERV